ncbi:hypothetical protein HPP92_005424 [Vanilla planifolia]|uniref:Uncharacterized protein n=1 Tax=Vanilla planifolia TaxID=51239 RepID=A0A835VD61_VANPL|nr:hypothetical protein HPP92_005424 [Vanilla planifolia]
MVHAGQEIIIFSGSYALHRHEKLAIALSKGYRSHSLQKRQKKGWKSSIEDIAFLIVEKKWSVLLMCLLALEVSDPSLSSKFFLRQHWMDDPENIEDSY